MLGLKLKLYKWKGPQAVLVLELPSLHLQGLLLTFIVPPPFWPMLATCWTIIMPLRYILSSVWIRLSIFSQLSIMQSIIQYVGLCDFSLPLPLWWLREYIYFVLLSSPIGSMNYYPLLRVRSWKNGVRCVSFYILMVEMRCSSFHRCSGHIPPVAPLKFRNG